MPTSITTIPTKTEPSLGQIKADGGSYTSPTTQTTAAQLEEMKTRIIQAIDNIGKSDGSTAGSIWLKLLFGFTLTVADAATAAIVIREVATDKLKIFSQGFSGKTDLYMNPEVPDDAGDPGFGVHIAAGVGGATDQNGGTLELDAGAANGAAVDGNVKIGRNFSTEILSGKEGVGSDWTHEGSLITTAGAQIAGALAALAKLNFSGLLTPAQITANQTDYTPTGYDAAFAFRINSDAARSLISLWAGTAGRMISLINTGSFTITLEHEHGSGTANSRFSLPGGVDYALGAGDGVVLWYDTTSSRWRALQPAASVGAVDYAETGDLLAVGAANDAGTSIEIPRADHVHAHGNQLGGALHAIATAAANGFLAATDFDRWLGNELGSGKNSEVIFRNEFTGSFGSDFTAVVGGASASCAVVGLSGRHGACRLYCGTTTTGFSELSRSTAAYYTNRYSSVYFRTKVEVDALSNATDEYDLWVCYTAASGVSFTYDRNTGINWQITKWTAGTPAHTDSGVVVAIDTVYDLTWVWTTAAGGTVTFYINGTSVGSVTGVAQSGVFCSPGRMIKSAGTGAPFTYIDQTEMVGILATPRN